LFRMLSPFPFMRLARSLFATVAVFTVAHAAAAPAAGDFAHWKPLYPDATPGLFGSLETGIRGAAQYLLWAKDGQVVSIAVTVQAPAKAAVTPVAPRITAPSGQEVKTESKGRPAQMTYDFTARETGVYLLGIEPKDYPVAVRTASAPLCLY